MKMPTIDRRSLVGGLGAAAVAGVPALATIASPSEALSINPKLNALAAALDKANAEFDHAFNTLEGADEQLFFNRCDAAEEFSEIAATDLNELCLKARYADEDSIAESIIRDLLAIDGAGR